MARPGTAARLELYFTPGTCARVPLIALEEIGVPFRPRHVDKATGEHLSPGYLALNPKGKVPTLVVDGEPLTENPAIQTWLARAYPEARLLPTGDPSVELDALATMSWFAAGVHPVITRTRFPHVVCDEPASHARIRQLGRAELARAFALLETRLAGREWLYGDWSIVDGYLLWLWCRATGSGMDATAFPRCAEHAARSGERPSVRRALALEESAATKKEVAER